MFMEARRWAVGRGHGVAGGGQRWWRCDEVLPGDRSGVGRMHRTGAARRRTLGFPPLRPGGRSGPCRTEPDTGTAPWQCSKWSTGVRFWRSGRALSCRSPSTPVRSALIGPNGAGKTTLFNVVSRIYEPTSGSVRFDGHDLLGLPAHRIAELGRRSHVPEPGAGARPVGPSTTSRWAVARSRGGRFGAVVLRLPPWLQPRSASSRPAMTCSSGCRWRPSPASVRGFRPYGTLSSEFGHLVAGCWTSGRQRTHLLGKASTSFPALIRQIRDEFCADGAVGRAPHVDGPAIIRSWSADLGCRSPRACSLPGPRPCRTLPGAPGDRIGSAPTTFVTIPTQKSGGAVTCSRCGPRRLRHVVEVLFCLGPRRRRWRAGRGARRQRLEQDDDPAGGVGDAGELRRDVFDGRSLRGLRPDHRWSRPASRTSQGGARSTT